MAIVLDASVALKWVLDEPDSALAQALLAPGAEGVLLPDFWLHEACNVCWLQVRKRVWSEDEAREALGLLRAQIAPTPTAHLDLHGAALELGLAVNHSTYDTLYVAFAVAAGARCVVAADGPFVRDMRRHADAAVRALVVPLAEWGGGRP